MPADAPGNRGRAPLRNRRMLLGLAAAAVAGLVSYVALVIGAILLLQAVAMLAFGQPWELGGIGAMAGLYLLFGLPLSLAACVAVGFPLWKRAERRAARSRGAALRHGMLAGAAIGLTLAVPDLVGGLAVRLDSGFSYNTYVYGHALTRDGVPTVLGWLQHLLVLGGFALAGAVGGLAARRVALGPRNGD